jgi:putative acetyltransferase
MANHRIVEQDPVDPQVTRLLELHLADAFANSPADKVHALPIERLRQPDVTFYAAWDDDRLAAMGALRRIDDARGELKTMRAAPEFRGKGAGEATLLHLIEQARCRGYTWLGLETGRTEPYRPAVSLYRKHGFAECAKFGDYLPDDFSQCLSRDL